MCNFFSVLLKHLGNGQIEVLHKLGSQCWYLNGKLHREDGPAEICADGDQIWYLNGKLHREDGPAEIYANGSQRWYLNGKPVPAPQEAAR